MWPQHLGGGETHDLGGELLMTLTELQSKIQNLKSKGGEEPNGYV